MRIQKKAPKLPPPMPKGFYRKWQWHMECDCGCREDVWWEYMWQTSVPYTSRPTGTTWSKTCDIIPEHYEYFCLLRDGRIPEKKIRGT